jgi:hypothetical protein
MVDSGSAWLGSCQRWLPKWLPEISLPSLTFDGTKTASIQTLPMYTAYSRRATRGTITAARPARLHAGLPRHRGIRGRHPPVAAVQPGRHRGPGPADLGRPSGDLQRGLQQARVRYYDAGRRRPGLPASVAALVSSIDPQATVVDLVNPDPEHDRTVIVQAGAFAEQTLQAVRYTACPDRSWLGGLYDYGHREPAVTEHHAEVRAPWLTVRLPASA